MAKLTREQKLTLCGRALCDQRTLDKYLAGGPVRAISAERIERAARELGIELKAVAA